MKTTTALSFLSLAFCCDSPARAVTFDWATVGNAGNVADTKVMNDGTTGYGSVDYTYRISKTEVTNTQYVEFLNSVAAVDPNGLYSTSMGLYSHGGIRRNGSSGNYTYLVKSDAKGGGAAGSDFTYGDKPVLYVSFFDAMRFVNWLENGQPTGSQGPGTTEDGVYVISDGFSEIRNPNATYFIPSEDEWYKAAYYDPVGVYYDYPMSTDFVPNNNLPSGDTGSSANFYDSGYTIGFAFSMTDVGAYALSASPYGTFEQGGNAREFNEAIFSINSIGVRGARGGAWYRTSNDLLASYRSGTFPTYENGGVSIRVASAIPEPTTLTLSTLALLGIGRWRRRA